MTVIPSSKRQRAQHDVVRYYWQRARNYPRSVLGIVLSIPFTILINAYLPALILADVLTKLASGNYQSGDMWASFGPQLAAYVTLLFLGIGAWRVVDHFSWQLELKVQQDIAEHVFRHLLSRSADFHANNFSGSLISQTNKLTSSYVRLADTLVYQVIPMISGIIIASTILIPRAWIFSVCIIAFACIYISIALFISRPVRDAGAKAAALESKQTGQLADAIVNALAIKSFSSADRERQRFHAATQRTRGAMREFARLHRQQMNRLGFMNRTISMMALFVAIATVMFFNAEIGTVFLIFNYTASIVEQLFQFSNNSIRNYNRTVGDAHEMVERLNQSPEVMDVPKPETLIVGNGSIAFDNVVFSHAGADDAIFQNFNLSIQAGEKIGLVGHSGSGKSTLVRLLLRFSDIDSGKVLIDGQNIAQITQDDLHSKIAYVPQEPLLFHRSIRENIAYGKPLSTDDDIIAAAKKANAHEFIQTLPDGYETLVGERGVKLSGGQRQRIAIARALIKDAPVLVLDEATSALDSESERLIQDALRKLMEGRTAIVIAHRLSTIQKMDRIVVLDHGAIIEQGSHGELLKHKGTYAQLWAHQSGGFIDE